MATMHVRAKDVGYLLLVLLALAAFCLLVLADTFWWIGHDGEAEELGRWAFKVGVAAFVVAWFTVLSGRRPRPPDL